MLSQANDAAAYPISATLNTTNPGAVQWPQARPTLTGGLAAGRISGLMVLIVRVDKVLTLNVTGSPAQVSRGEDVNMLNLDDHRTRRKNTPGDQSMRRTIQDLVSSVDPNVKIEPEVEDVSLFKVKFSSKPLIFTTAAPAFNCGRVH